MDAAIQINREEEREKLESDKPKTKNQDLTASSNLRSTSHNVGLKVLSTNSVPLTMDEEGEEVSLQRLEQAGYQQRLPGTAEEAANVEDLLADELSKLSVVEHDMLSFDVHGFATEIEETEELIQRCLNEMEQELQKIEKKSSYEKALKMDPEYVTSRSFRLQFLRCESFNCEYAAGRIVLHFQQKEELFGSGEVLVRDVRLSDMDATTMEIIKSGAAQVLPTRDVSGRAVLTLFLSKWGNAMDVKGAQRLQYYLTQSIVQDQASSQKAIVIVLYLVGKRARPFTLDLVRKIYRYRLAVPHRLEAMHYCFNNRKLRPFVSGIRLFMGKRARMRSRVHFGNEEQLLFQLQTYGISIPEDSPLRTVDGDLSLVWQEEWIRIRQAQEIKLEGMDNDEMSRIVVPHRFDVLFGRGSKVRSHTGNLRALHLVNMHQIRYDGASNRFEKAGISERIVSIIHESNGRSLKWDEAGGWIEVDDETARDKVSHWFRNQRSAANKAEKTKTPKRNRSVSETNESAKK